MDTRRVLSGVIVWSVGLFVPVLYHLFLIYVANQGKGEVYWDYSMFRPFFALPWIIWPYLAAMAIVGGCLVVSGIKRHDGRNE